ncbi:putative ABC transporter permease [Pseudoramibacter porci]|uniref:Putative ABC transporter permease n=1 Tax=Pseudoramibacter porci TaxID=2606631 RepID=A0A7X2NFL8_9FIRM|nr:putative ABC transporter permease [Pseudoramibacter porci]MSS19536.1 putative ABC transporter permease [Pseudoramibacter porci]
MIAGMTIYQIAWYFLIYSFLGWVVEVVFHAVHQGRIVNRGFLNGPVCPVYGFGVLAVFAVAWAIGRSAPEGLPLWQLFLVGMVFATLVELIAGWTLDKLFHTRWWDYSDKPLNLGGYICPEYSLIWGLAITLVVRDVQPLVRRTAADQIPADYGWIVLAVFYCAYLADLIVTVLIITGFNKRLAELDAIRLSLRTVSDKLTEDIGGGAMEATQRVQEGEVQAALARAEMGERAAARRETAENALWQRRNALKAKAKHIRQRVMAPKVFGGRRLMRAFPSMQHRDFGEVLDWLRNDMQKEKSSK